MPKEKTYEICRKVEKLLGCKVPAVKRLLYLDESIWRFGILKCNKKHVKADFTYNKNKIFGYSRTVHDNVEVEIDDEILERIIEIFEEEYEKQVNVCEKLISKLEK